MIVLGKTVTKDNMIKYAGIKKDIRETKNNLEKLEERAKKYPLYQFELEEQKTLQQHLKTIETNIPMLNSYTDDVINKDKKFFSKLSSYDFDNSILNFCL